MRAVPRVAAFAAGVVLTAAFVPGVAAAGGRTADASDAGGQLLRASVAGSLPTDLPVAGVAPGGVPWVVDRGTVRLGEDGSLDVTVSGLIVPTTGTNPVASLAASVVCNGAVVDTTATVAFTPEGDARIREAVSIPQRCLAPVVLLNPGGNVARFIGVTGSEA